MASVIEDLQDIYSDLKVIKAELKDLFTKTSHLADFLEEQIDRLEED